MKINQSFYFIFFLSLMWRMLKEGRFFIFLVSTEVPVLCLENSYYSVNDMLYKSMFENNDIENFLS